MADYDVAVTELSSPPPSAVKTTYRPAVQIRNNGIHDALASGILRIYSAGRLIFTTEIYSTVIPPKETREAQAVNYWTPETEGSYLVIADATCPLDQVETNNHLSPTTVIVGPGEVPVPPIVTQHAAQHEEGGTDQISIDGLRGEAYDPQPPKDHVSRHEQGGSDELSVGGLHGQLADAQPTEDHGNEHHTKIFETVSGCTAQIGTHNSTTAPHPGTTNLEYVERKGAADGYAPLNGDGLVPAENLPTIEPSAHAPTHSPLGTDPMPGFMSTSGTQALVGAGPFQLCSSRIANSFWTDNPAICASIMMRAYISNPGPLFVRLVLQGDILGRRILSEFQLFPIGSRFPSNILCQYSGVFPNNNRDGWLLTHYEDFAGDLQHHLGWYPGSSENHNDSGILSLELEIGGAGTQSIDLRSATLATPGKTA